jgi:hypothetical protein
MPFYSLAYSRLSWILYGDEGLDLELTFALYSLVKSGFPCEAVGTGSFTDTAMLIPRMLDLHFRTFQGVKPSLSTMVSCGFADASKRGHALDCK